MLTQSLIADRIEEPRSKQRGIFDRKEFCLNQIRSLTPQHAKHCRMAEPTGNALAVAVHGMRVNAIREILKVVAQPGYDFPCRRNSGARKLPHGHYPGTDPAGDRHLRVNGLSVRSHRGICTIETPSG